MRHDSHSPMQYSTAQHGKWRQNAGNLRSLPEKTCYISGNLVGWDGKCRCSMENLKIDDWFADGDRCTKELGCAKDRHVMAYLGIVTLGGERVEGRMR